MNENRPSDYNIAINVINDLYVSTATWHTLIMAANEWVKTWETFVFSFDPQTKQRGNILKQYYHNHEHDAIDFHFRYCKAITYHKMWVGRKSLKILITNAPSTKH
jgi:hypothetical protein